MAAQPEAGQVQAEAVQDRSPDPGSGEEGRGDAESGGSHVARDADHRTLDSEPEAAPGTRNCDEEMSSSGWREDFRCLCQDKLQLDEDTFRFCRDLLESCHPALEMTLGNIGSHEEAEAERLWAVCALYLTRKLRPEKKSGGEPVEVEDGDGPHHEAQEANREGTPMDVEVSRAERTNHTPAPAYTLSLLLDATGLTVADFFREMTNFLTRAGPVLDHKFGKDWERHLDVGELQSNFSHTLVIFNHYKKVFGELFHSDVLTASTSASAVESGSALVRCSLAEGADGDLVPGEFRLGWLLFLLFRGRLLRPFPDLVSCTNALLCAMVLLIVHVPAKTRRFSFTDSVRFSKRRKVEAQEGEEETEKVDLVASVSLSYSAVEEDIAALLRRSQALLKNLLNQEPTPLAAWQGRHGGRGVDGSPRVDGDPLSLSALHPEGLAVFEGLLGSAEIAGKLEAGYEQYLISQDPAVWGEVDGRLLTSAVGPAAVCPRQLLGVASLMPPGSTNAALANPLFASTPGPKPSSGPTAAAAGLAPSRMGPSGGSQVRRALGMGDSGFVSAPTTMSTPTRHTLPAGRLAQASGGPVASPLPAGASTPSATPLPRHFLTRLQPATPVSTAMTTASWLRTIVAPSPAEPGEELLKYLHACNRDLTEDLVGRTRDVSRSIFDFISHHTSGASQGVPVSSPAHDARWPELRRLETVKLYYRILLRMCVTESERNGTGNLTQLLDNDRFHRSLLACSAELVLASHKATAHTFPSILEPAGVSAFDMDKVMESFVRHEETLPAELKKHLHACDEKILESLAWARGSTLYVALIAARRHLAAEIVRLGLLPPPRSQSQSTGSAVPGAGQVSAAGSSTVGKVLVYSEVGGDRSEGGHGSTISGSMDGAVKAEGDEGGAAAGSPSKEAREGAAGGKEEIVSSPMDLAKGASSLARTPSAKSGVGALGGSGTAWGHCAEAQLSQFSQKVLKLGLVRARALCERLKLPPAVLEMVYRVVEHCVCSEVQLMFQRHLDQIILCALYGVCKVKQVQVTFKDIIGHYRKQPQCKPQVFRNVFIDEREEAAPPAVDPTAPLPRVQVTGDIIKFYNEIFVPATKSFLLHLGQQQQAQAQQQQQQQQQGQAASRSMGEPRGVGSLQQQQMDASYASPAGKGGNQLSSASKAGGGIPPSSPHVPTGSPRRVSAAHNVYVSPLPLSKAEALLSSPLRPQMSAQLGLIGGCAGAALGAGGGVARGNLSDLYTSPARKLAAINSRISATRRLGRLDFSEAMVAEGGRPQDGPGGSNLGPGPGAPTGGGQVPRTTSVHSLTSAASWSSSQQHQLQQAQPSQYPGSPGLSGGSKRVRIDR